ncbi:Signal transducer regulating beta-lactamase production, contains metallopeptidase domain [Flavobacterium resistens]|uniref:Regulatory sensor-transducer, BlaR1/MecR1 family protein n=1 Tax=Flavobacterium resistens TaxID=443612 RepID=A0A521CB23_9FLAO|nr:M56 family metallopeptidase [Flavobacterium resistens]MRX66500.1 regulatory sensor-transducer, BlaR1/MecR1 family protein [Flavobacterium resistens]SMO56629.1 Signal transducer regulating beta-lactamase production, contains metallopeptidase domain [Flavobacterium resistens]
MTDFLIKSAIALASFLAFYHFVLEREKMHQFNRFFLLFAIVFSLVVPFVSFEIIKEIPVNSSNLQVVNQPLIQMQTVVEKTNYKLIFLWSLYALVTLILALRFGRNIKNFKSKISSNPAVDFKNSKLILVEEKILPHTFLNYIFINADDYKTQNIEAELYMHELVHVSQKHTLDILFVEFLKTIFWFNPLFLFYKKAIQLNHEFLADQEIVKTYNDVPFYQNLLLNKASGTQTIYLASNLNYLVTKKRLIMMKKRTSKNTAFLKKIAALPVVIGLMFLLCVETIAQETKTDIKNQKAQNASSFDKYYANTAFVFKSKSSKVFVEKKYSELTEQEKKLIPPVPSLAKKSPDSKEYEGFKNSENYAVWIDGKHVSNSELNEYQASNFVSYFNSIVHKNARSKKFPQRYQVTLFTAEGYDKAYGKNQIRDAGTITIMASEDTRKSKIQKTPEKETTATINDVERQPEYPGGILEFYKFVGKNFKVPSEEAANKIQGKVIVEFMIETDGSLSEFQVVKDLGFGIGDEAIRVLKLSPKWNPGIQKGQPVRVLYTLPITIQNKDTAK